MPTTDPTTCDDSKLVARARSEEQAAFAELVRRHHRAALRVAAVICGSTEEANDIVQDAFVNIHRNLGSYRGDGSVRSWMLRVVANHAKNHVRGRERRRRRDDQHARLEVRRVDGPDVAVEEHLQREQLAEALGRLSVDDREILGCRYVTGLGEAETADTLGIPVGTVKSRTSRALGRLRSELATMGSEGPT